MPVAALVIGLVYRVQYRSGRVLKIALVALHGLSVAAIVFVYFWLCFEHRIDTIWKYVGWPVFGTGALLFWYAAFRHKASLVPQEGYPPYFEGPYRYVRHPIYSGGLLGAAGLLLIVPTWQVLVVWVLLFVSLWFLLIDEEGELRDRYGNDYISYSQRTKKLIPWVL